VNRIFHAFGFLLATLLAGFAQPSDLTLPVGELGAGKILDVVGGVILREPDGTRGQYKKGFRVYNDSAADWQKFYGVQFEINLPDAREVELTATILRAQRNTNTTETPVSGNISINGKGWHTITLPWRAFDFSQANTSFLKFVKEFQLDAKCADGQPVKFQLRNARVVRAPVISLTAEVRGKSAPQNGFVEYDVAIGNCTGVKQSVSLKFVKRGWEEMTASVEPESFELAAGDIRNVKVRVEISGRVPHGGHEEQVLEAIGNGDAARASQLKFVTTSEVRHP